MDFKVLIADDDSTMRLILSKIIDSIDGFKLIGEAEDGDSVLSNFMKEKPDIIFMDIEMPKIDGLECAKRISDIDPKTIIIFQTAHGEYMPEAFEVYAFDYLIKPFKVERIRKTLNRIKNLKLEYENNEELIYENNNINKLVIKNKDGINFIDTDDIILIQREDRISAIYTKNNKYTTSEGLRDLEERLEKNIFYRSHKSYIINITKINKIEHYGRWTYIVKFKNTDLDALITHKKYEEIEKYFL